MRRPRSFSSESSGMTSLLVVTSLSIDDRETPLAAHDPANPPLSKIENTRIGMRFSRARAIAAASITCRSRASTSR